jgi:hypothetical protein
VDAPELGFSFEVTLHDERRVVKRIIVETVVPEGEERGKTVSFVVSRLADD